MAPSPVLLGFPYAPGALAGNESWMVLNDGDWIVQATPAVTGPGSAGTNNDVGRMLDPYVLGWPTISLTWDMLRTSGTNTADNSIVITAGLGGAPIAQVDFTYTGNVGVFTLANDTGTTSPISITMTALTYYTFKLVVSETGMELFQNGVSIGTFTLGSTPNTAADSILMHSAHDTGAAPRFQWTTLTVGPN